MLNDLGYEGLPHPPYSPELSPIDYHLFKHLDNFLQGKCFHSQQEEEKAFQEFIESWSMDFYTREINLFPVDKNVLLVMVPNLINKDVFEPRYNDLKFTIRTSSYFCINLIQLCRIFSAINSAKKLTS